MVSRFGAEAVGEEVGGVGVDDGVTEGVVFEVGGGGAGGGEVFADVAVAVVGGGMGSEQCRVISDQKETADAAGALWGVAEVSAPEAGLFQSKNRRDACAPFIISDAVPSVVEIEGGGAGGGITCNLGDAAGLSVVGGQ